MRRRPGIFGACRLSAVLLAAVLLPAGAGAAANPAGPPHAAPPALVFDLDQGFPWGIIEKGDLRSLDRIFATLGAFRRRYQIYVVIDPLTAKPGALRAVLEAAARRHIPFLLDAATSDALTIGSLRRSVAADADITHGQPLALQDLRVIKHDPVLGPDFAGLRFMELMAEDFTTAACRARLSGPGRVDWCDGFVRNLPVDGFLHLKDRIKPLLDFARDEHLWVLWSDWKWDAQTASQQAALRRLLAAGEYRRIVTLAYADNLPLEAARDDDADWRRWRAAYAPLVGRAIRGLGLSDQSWTCADEAGCPAEVLIRWAKRALATGAQALEFEPVWHFFTLPARAEPSYPNSPYWRAAGGRPTDQLRLLAAALGVDLPEGLSRSAAAGAPRRAACLSLVAPHRLKSGAAFTARVSFQNTGATAWSAAHDRLGWFKGDGAAWGAPEFAFPGAPVAPGKAVRFVLRLKAPLEAGPHLLSLRLVTKGEGGFGGRCSRLVIVEP